MTHPTVPEAGPQPVEPWKPDIEGLKRVLPQLRAEAECPICRVQRGYCAEHRPDPRAEVLAAADAMAEAWANGGWRISTSYPEIERAYERYLEARGRAR